MENLQYPLGKFKIAKDYSTNEIDGFLDELESFPSKLEKVLDGINQKQLSNAYRPGGWTTQQIIHHLSDSHSNMLTRLKWTLTEDTPKIKAYFEDRWAALPDYYLPYQISVDMLKIIHTKIVAILSNLSEDELNKAYVHPETNLEFKLKTVMALYAWHGNHHIAHIKICKGEW